MDREKDTLVNSTTVAVDVQHEESHSNIISENNDLIGSFTVTSSSGENLENVNSDFEGHEIDKSLTLAMCRPGRTLKDGGIRNDITVSNGEYCERRQMSKNPDELATIDEEKPVVCSDDVLISTTDLASVDCNDNTETINDTKQLHKPEGPPESLIGFNTNSSINTHKPPDKLCDPIVDKKNGDNEPSERNNRRESSDPRRHSSTSSHAAVGISSTPVSDPVEFESGKERKHSTGEAVSKNICPLSLDSSAKRAQSGRMDTRTTPIGHKENRLPSIINTDERTSKNKTCNRRKSSSCSSGSSIVNAATVSVNRTRCQSSKGVRERNTKLQRNSVISRSYDKSVNILGSQNSSESSERQRPVSAFEQRYTVRELRKALPRKSFFSCHEKAMKDAGLETDDPEKRRKAERLKARLARIANEFSPLPSARYNSDPQGAVNNVINITINDGQDPLSGDINGSTGFDKLDTVVSNNNLDISVDVINTTTEPSVSRHEPSKLGVKSSHTTKKRPGSARQERIECKPLMQYLEYVKDNKEEYLHHSHTSTPQARPYTVSRLINLGKAFELRHLGGIPRHHDDDAAVVMAARALRPRTSDPAKYTKIERDKSATYRGQTRPSSEDKRKQESHAKEEEHAKTELERKRIRAEEWTKSVSTNTLTRAKIQSLRELGADDVEIVKWWDAFKTCRYLRDTGPVEEKVS